MTRSLLNTNRRFQSLDREAAVVIRAMTGSGVKISKKKEVQDMCKAELEMMQDAREEGREMGMREGRETGLREGRTGAIREMIKNMQKQHLSPEQISLYTGTSLEIVLEIFNSNKEKQPSTRCR